MAKRPRLPKASQNDHGQSSAAPWLRDRPGPAASAQPFQARTTRQPQGPAKRSTQQAQHKPRFREQPENTDDSDTGQ